MLDAMELVVHLDWEAGTSYVEEKGESLVKSRGASQKFAKYLSQTVK
jgi:hypothetical protein